MKLGIMGTGRIVQEVLPVLSKQGLEKCFLAGRENSAERTRALCSQYDLDGYFLDTEEMLEADIDTVYIALPNHLHFSAAKRALEAGKNAIIEKPVCGCVEEFDELARDAREKGVFMLEAMSTPHLPAFCGVKSLLPQMGEIRSAEFRFYQYSRRYDAFLEGHIEPVFDPACLGGALMDLNVYNIYALVDLFGEPKSASYDAHMERGIDTGGTVTMDFGSFAAEASAAKDSEDTAPSVIRGENADILIPVTMNGVDRYEIRARGAQSGELLQFGTGEHRLAFEFREFERIIREDDRQRADELAGTGRIVTGLLEGLRPY